MLLRRTRRGFTLLELMVVIGILVLLATAAVPVYLNQRDKAKKQLAQAAVGVNGTLSSALDHFRSDCDRYPSTEEGLNALKAAPEEEKVKAKWGPNPYVKPNVEFKDPWGTEYQYKCPGEHNATGFDLSSAGPNGVHGDDDDIVNWATEAR